MAWSASLQPLVIAALLAFTGVMKLRGNAERARETALGRLVGKERAAAALRSVGGLELCVVVALLLPFGRPVTAGASALLAAGFLGYLGYAKVAAPESDCGCTGAAKEPVGWRSFARAGLLGGLSVFALAGALAMPSSSWWGEAVIAAPLAAAGLTLAELALFGALTPEYDRYWLLPMRQLKVRLTHPLGGFDDGAAPLLATVQQLQVSEAYRQVGTMIASDVRDSWDEGEWRILEYAARRDGQRTTAVFAVPLHRYDPDAVRVAFVDESREEPVSAPA
ncbi:MAG: hypothetical protein GEU94_16045 [Micromonosporaceae bacterium]|nr:hypothetical protein [Micromonosporaceae bacterium]